jgi:putative transposase
LPGCTAPSNRWRKAKARVAALHTRVANARRDGLHKLSTRLVREHDTIVIEDLHVAGMIRNKRLARHIAQLGMGEFRRQLTYKAAEASARLIVADRWYPSSKTCSACGAVRAKLTLAEREFACQSCGARMDRDLNAALNLAALADRVVLGELRPDVKQPAGNPGKTTTGGTGYCHGKTPGPTGSQRHPREAVAR